MPCNNEAGHVDFDYVHISVFIQSINIAEHFVVSPPMGYLDVNKDDHVNTFDYHVVFVFCVHLDTS